MGVLAGCRHTDDALPVVVHVAEFIGQPLHVVRLQTTAVVLIIVFLAESDSDLLKESHSLNGK